MEIELLAAAAAAYCPAGRELGGYLPLAARTLTLPVGEGGKDATLLASALS